MSFDRFAKLIEPQSVPTLAHILLADTEKPRIDLLTRSAETGWDRAAFERLEARLELPAIGATLCSPTCLTG